MISAQTYFGVTDIAPPVSGTIRLNTYLEEGFAGVTEVKVDQHYRHIGAGRNAMFNLGLSNLLKGLKITVTTILINQCRTTCESIISHKIYLNDEIEREFSYPVKMVGYGLKVKLIARYNIL